MTVLDSVWKSERLDSSLVEITSGFACAKSKSVSIGLPHLRPFNINLNGEVDLSQIIYIPENFLSNIEQYRLQKGDILFNNTNSLELVGKSALVKEPMVCAFSNHLTRIRVIAPDRLDPAWLLLFLRNYFIDGYFSANSNRWIGQVGFAASKLSQLSIPLPELETQKRIVLRLETLLGEVKSARELQESIEEETNLLVDSVLTEIFASRDQWQNEKPLDELVSIEASLVDPREPEYSKLPHIYGASIESGTGRLLDYQSAAEDGMTSNKYLFEPGVVLYSKIRPYLRKVTIADFKGVCSADMYPLTVASDEILPEFLMWTLLSPEFTEFINAFSLRARIPKVNREQLMAYRMRYPDINSQKKIAAYIQNWRDEVSEMQRAQHENAALLEQAEQSLLAQAFRGEL